MMMLSTAHWRMDINLENSFTKCVIQDAGVSVRMMKLVRCSIPAAHSLTHSITHSHPPSLLLPSLSPYHTHGVLCSELRGSDAEGQQDVVAGGSATIHNEFGLIDSAQVCIDRQSRRAREGETLLSDSQQLMRNQRITAFHSNTPRKSYPTVGGNFAAEIHGFQIGNLVTRSQPW